MNAKCGSSANITKLKKESGVSGKTATSDSSKVKMRNKKNEY